MFIFPISSTNFTSKNVIQYKSKFDKKTLEMLKSYTQNKQNTQIYSDIDLFLSGNINKAKYLKKVNLFAQGITNRDVLNDAEKQYIGDMIATMDLFSKEKIPENYIIDNIKNLLNNQ